MNLHDKHITLRLNPSRLDEKKKRENEDSSDDDYFCIVDYYDAGDWDAGDWDADDWDADEVEGGTPLTSSAEFGNIMVVEFLLNLGANIEATDEALLLLHSLKLCFHSLALGFVLGLSWHLFVSVFFFFGLRMCFDCCLCLCCHQNRDTALALACKKGHFDVVQLLLNHGANVINENKVNNIFIVLVKSIYC